MGNEDNECISGVVEEEDKVKREEVCLIFK